MSEEKFREVFVTPSDGIAKADAWVEGHHVGYIRGRDDGITIGHANARLWYLNALNSVERKPRADAPTIALLRDAFNGVSLG